MSFREDNQGNIMRITRADLDSFYAFAVEKLAKSNEDLGWLDLLEWWQLENPTEEEMAAVRENIRQGLEDIEAGRYMPMDEFNEMIERKYGFKTK